MKNIVIFLLIFGFYFNAMAQKKTITKNDTETVDKQIVMSYRYIDGSNNTYIISSKNVEYLPITPEKSSSGVYSGGKPFNVIISAEQATEINNLLADAISNSDIQLKTRLKGTGKIIKITKDINTETAEAIILKMNAPEKIAIEKWLKALN